MRMFVSMLISIFLCAAPCAVGAESLQYSLKDAVEAGLEANPGVEATKKILEQSELNINAARGYFLPSFTLQSSISSYSQKGDVVSVDQVDQDVFSNGFKISQPLFSGFAILSNYLKSKLQADMDKAKFDQARLDLIIYIQKTFLQLLKSKEDLATVENEIVRLAAQLEASRVFYKAGIDPYTDVLKSEVELVKAQGDKIKVQNSIKNYSTQLNTYLALDFNKRVEYAGDLHDYNIFIPHDEESAIREALIKRPDLIIGRKSVDIAKKESEKAFAQYLPKITLDYSKFNQKTEYENYAYSETTRYYESIAVNLNWKIFDGGATTYTFLGELKRVGSLEKSLEDQEAAAKADIIKSFTDIEDAKKLIEISRKAKAVAKENYDMAAARYRTRIGTINDLLDAQYKLTQSESELSNAYMQYHVARATLFYNIGVENSGLQ